jgi:ABC-type sugar transport system ATPase subunit
LIQIDNVTITAGTFRIENASFSLPAGSYGVLMGKTGSGKTTLLESIAGLKQIDGGRILLGDRDVTTAKPAERNIGYVPQDGALFSTMTVRDQLSLALVIRKAPRADIVQRVSQLAALLEIESLLERGVRRLSGGEKQRVALGRALSFWPDTLLLDEPLSALDDSTRCQMYELLKHVQAETGVTTLHVTHHHADARHLADYVFTLTEGHIVETDMAKE